MIKVYKDDISDLGTELIAGTKEFVYEELMENAYPGIYIESELRIECAEGVMCIEDQHIELAGKTILTVVVELQDMGIEAYLTSDTIAMTPAELIVDYSNSVYRTVDIDKSPKPLSELHSKEIINIPGLSESSISREIVSVVSKSLSLEDADNGGYHEYNIDNGNLYINKLTHDTRCIYKYTANKFFLFISDKSVIDINKMLQKDHTTSLSKILLRSMNAINTDKL